VKNFDLVIFDCDGVLVDSELLGNQADIELFASLNIQLDLEDYMLRYVGVSARETVRGIEQQTGRKLPENILELKQQNVFRRFERELKAIDGVLDVLKSLKLARCVASSSVPERIQFSLGLTGLLPLLEPHLFSSTMVARGKPAPDLFLYAATSMKCDPGRCIVIEDSEVGVQAAMSAGMHAIGFYGGSHCRGGHDERLRQAGARWVLRDMREVGYLLGQ
jgi:HAD superfamily hydrolase (TIGR01509 family)